MKKEVYKKKRCNPTIRQVDGGQKDKDPMTASTRGRWKGTEEGKYRLIER